MKDVIVVGAGLAGLTAALRLARAGRSVTLVAKGQGGLGLSTGCIDILGYAPDRVFRPVDAVASLPPDHPYAALGAEAVREAVVWLRDELGPELLVGDADVNWHLPTAVGALRPTALAQPSMVAAAEATSLAVVGVRQLKDFPADLLAGNLARSRRPDGTPLDASVAWVDLPARAGEADPSGLTYARALDDAAFAQRFGRAVAAAAGAGDVVLLPGVLGIRPGSWRRVQDAVGRPIAEVPLQPPSIPGIRLFDALLAKVKAAGVRYVIGSRVVGFVADGDRVAALTVAVAGGTRTLAASDVVFAPGGFESGALTVDSHGRITEPVFGLPLTADDASGLVSATYAGPQALFEVGVRTDAQGRPVDADGRIVHPNLYVAGGILAGPEPWREKSGEGLAVASASRAASSIEGGRR